MRIRSSLLLLPLLLSPSCSDDTEDTLALCTDGLDNDGDRKVDCRDPDCQAFHVCHVVDAGQEDLAVEEDAAEEEDLSVEDLRGHDLVRRDLRPADLTRADGRPDAAIDLRVDDGPRPPVDESLIFPVPESEPNDGTTKTEFNPMFPPMEIFGSIGKPDDVDLFGMNAVAGQRLVVVLQALGNLDPHVAIFGDAALGVPATVVAGATHLVAEYYVLKDGMYYLAVRDRRNVGSSSAHVGGVNFDYSFGISYLLRPPIAAAVGKDTAAKLDPPGTVLVFAFDATAGDNLEVTALAKRLAPASSIDTRLSLFFPAMRSWHGTNDDISLTQTDSLLTGKMPFTGTYHAIVENEADPGPVANNNVALRITKLP